MTTRARTCVVAMALLGALAGAVPAWAQDRYAFIVSGASGGAKFAENQKKWIASLENTLRERLGFASDRLTILSEGGTPANAATRENVANALTALRQRVTQEDVLLVILIGHGTFDGASAKFNLTGPDMDAKEWRLLLDGIAGRLVFVNTTSSSFPFLQEISGKDRVVITATDSVAQRYDTIFPQFFIEGLDLAVGDSDKNGRLSIWEAFGYASQAVKRWYDGQGQLATERPLIDDNADGVGKEALATGPDGVLARTTFVDPEPDVGGAGGELAALQKRRVALEAQIEALKARKADVPAEQYEAELEKLAVELARVARQIREGQ